MSAAIMALPAQAETKHTRALSELAKEFLRLGFVAYGGPAAHIAMMEERFVRRRGWVSRERFLDLLGAVNLLPGPSSTELAIYLGEVRGGLAGLIIAGACFILPAAVLVVGLAWVYGRFGTMPQVAGLLFGIKPVVVALIAQAVWNLARTALKSVALAVLAAAVIALAILGLPVLMLLIGAGVLWMLIHEGRKLAKYHASAVGVLGVFSVGAGSAVGILPLFLYFLKVGAALFGSGYVLLAVLRADLVVRLHWLTDAHAGRHCGEPSDDGTVFYRGDVYRVPLGRMEGRGSRYSRNVSACVCVRRCDGGVPAKVTQITGGECVSGWGECFGSSAHGVCGLAVHAGGAGEYSGDGAGAGQRRVGLPV